MKRIVALVIALALIAAGGYFGYEYYRGTYLATNHGIYRLDATSLNLSGMEAPDLAKIANLTGLKKLDLRNTGLTVAEYETLQAALPDCEILWQVPIQGQYLELDAETLEITALTQEELESLQYLPKLSHVSAEGCSDLDMLMQLRKRYPEIQVDYLVTVGSKTVAGNTEVLTGCPVPPEELAERLQYLPELKELSLAIARPDNEAVYALTQEYPDVQFRWNVELCGKRYASTVRELDLSGIQVASELEVENALKYFPNLERVVMCGCGIPSEAMDALWKRNPEIRFVWSVKIANFTVRTDVTTFMPYQYGCASLQGRNLSEMKYLVDVVCMDLGHMGITDISFLRYMTNLEYLIIADCEISDLSPMAGLTKLKYLEAFQNNLRDISPLAGCTALRDLNLCYNRIWDFSPLYELEHLEHLWIMDNYVNNYTRDELEARFPDATIMYHTFSSTGNGWRNIPGYYEQRDLLGMWYMTG